MLWISNRSSQSRLFSKHLLFLTSQEELTLSMRELESTRLGMKPRRTVKRSPQKRLRRSGKRHPQRKLNKMLSAWRVLKNKHHRNSFKFCPTIKTGKTWKIPATGWKILSNNPRLFQSFEEVVKLGDMAYESVGRTFKSCRAHQRTRGSGFLPDPLLLWFEMPLTPWRWAQRFSSVAFFTPE